MNLGLAGLPVDWRRSYRPTSLPIGFSLFLIFDQVEVISMAGRTGRLAGTVSCVLKIK